MHPQTLVLILYTFEMFVALGTNAFPWRKSASHGSVSVWRWLGKHSWKVGLEDKLLRLPSWGPGWYQSGSLKGGCPTEQQSGLGAEGLGLCGERKRTRIFMTWPSDRQAREAGVERWKSRVLWQEGKIRLAYVGYSSMR